jgi:hypothetical protein
MSNSQSSGIRVGEYRYDTSVCDVADKECLAAFRERYSEWIHWMRLDIDNSIWRQIYTMMWNDAVYRIINESRRLSQKTGMPSVSQNGVLGEFIDQSYVATQILAIRRLTERAPPSQQRGKQVISLRRVIEDMSVHRLLLTRENYVCYDGLPYNYEPVMHHEFAEFAARIEKEGATLRTKRPGGPDDWSQSRRRHQAFDRLVGKEPSSRERHDRIRKEIFSSLESAIDGCGHEQLITYGNKYIAHAADALSRRAATGLEKHLTLNKFSKVHKTLCQISFIISTCLLFDLSSSIIPTAQFEWKKNLDKPWVERDKFSDLQDLWNSHKALTESWISGDVFSELFDPSI